MAQRISDYHSISQPIGTDGLKISLIVATSHHNVIGYRNRLPWHLPADLKHFKALTMGKPVIMGRNTFDSMGKPLPGRRNIVISRDKKLHIQGVEIFHSIDAALNALATTEEVMIIGGAHVYAQTLHRAECIYMTSIDAEFEGDTFFPPLNDEWILLLEETFLPDADNKYPYRFLVYKKIYK